MNIFVQMPVMYTYIYIYHKINMYIYIYIITYTPIDVQTSEIPSKNLFSCQVVYFVIKFVFFFSLRFVTCRSNIPLGGRPGGVLPPALRITLGNASRWFWIHCNLIPRGCVSSARTQYRACAFLCAGVVFRSIASIRNIVVEIWAYTICIVARVATW